MKLYAIIRKDTVYFQWMSKDQRREFKYKYRKVELVEQHMDEFTMLFYEGPLKPEV